MISHLKVAMTRLSRFLVSALASALFYLSPGSGLAATKNVVLVHGIGMEGAGASWRAVYDILKRDGYEVTIVQQPLTGFDGDVKATRRIIDRQRGGVVLVGHSYGGMVITTAGNHPEVKALVYVAAFLPDAGESLASLSARIPAAYDPKGRIVGSDRYVSFTKEVFIRDVGQDLSLADAEYLVASQTPTSGNAFTAVTARPAWRAKPVIGQGRGRLIPSMRSRRSSPDEMAIRGSLAAEAVVLTRCSVPAFDGSDR